MIHCKINTATSLEIQISLQGLFSCKFVEIYIKDLKVLCLCQVMCQSAPLTTNFYITSSQMLITIETSNIIGLECCISTFLPFMCYSYQIASDQINCPNEA